MFTLISELIAKGGLLGVFLLMLVENLIPAIPSELILPLAGFEASRGAFNPALAVAVGSVGSILGGWAWYELGRIVGLERLKKLAQRGGRWVAVTPDEIEHAHAWFSRWCGLAVCIGRTLPGIRGVICIPAGVAHMPRWRFLIWSSVGATIWSALLVLGGLALGTRYTKVQVWLNPVTDAFLGLCLAVYLWRLIRPKRVRQSAD